MTTLKSKRAQLEKQNANTSAASVNESAADTTGAAPQVK